LKLAEEHLLAMIEHARTCYPNEAVGLLGGPAPGAVSAVYRLENVGPPNTFVADPYGQWKALEEMKRTDTRLVAVYHSHPDGGTTPSQADLHFAHGWDALFLIVALEAGREAPVAVSAYRLNKERGEAIEIVVSE
jgi:proteasome lid subunit RPN8/RPN11